jgi:hypothetical protein
VFLYWCTQYCDLIAKRCCSTQLFVFLSIHTALPLYEVFFFPHVSWGEVRLIPLRTSIIIWSIVPAPDDGCSWVWSSRWNENWQWKPKYSKKTCPSAFLSATNPIRPDLSSNPGPRSAKPTTNHLSSGTISAVYYVLLLLLLIRVSHNPVSVSNILFSRSRMASNSHLRTASESKVAGESCAFVSLRRSILLFRIFITWMT